MTIGTDSPDTLPTPETDKPQAERLSISCNIRIKVEHPELGALYLLIPNKRIANKQNKITLSPIMGGAQVDLESLQQAIKESGIQGTSTNQEEEFFKNNRGNESLVVNGVIIENIRNGDTADLRLNEIGGNQNAMDLVRQINENGLIDYSKTMENEIIDELGPELLEVSEKIKEISGADIADMQTHEDLIVALRDKIISQLNNVETTYIDEPNYDNLRLSGRNGKKQPTASPRMQGTLELEWEDVQALTEGDNPLCAIITNETANVSGAALFLVSQDKINNFRNQIPPNSTAEELPLGVQMGSAKINLAPMI